MSISRDPPDLGSRDNNNCGNRGGGDLGGEEAFSNA